MLQERNSLRTIFFKTRKNADLFEPHIIILRPCDFFIWILALGGLLFSILTLMAGWEEEH
jgi:hypothetical protein